jgi:hypothetical protein
VGDCAEVDGALAQSTDANEHGRGWVVSHHPANGDPNENCAEVDGALAQSTDADEHEAGWSHTTQQMATPMGIAPRWTER